MKLNLAEYFCTLLSDANEIHNGGGDISGFSRKVMTFFLVNVKEEKSQAEFLCSKLEYLINRYKYSAVNSLLLNSVADAFWLSAQENTEQEDSLNIENIIHVTSELVTNENLRDICIFVCHNANSLILFPACSSKDRSRKKNSKQYASSTYDEG
jgi:hypothetical protein